MRRVKRRGWSMSANDSDHREMERLLERHFDSGADDVPPTPDLWASLEGRLGQQEPRPLWAAVRDLASVDGGLGGVPAIAAAAAVIIAAVSVSVWYTVGRGGDGPEVAAVAVPVPEPTVGVAAERIVEAEPATEVAVARERVVEVEVEKIVTVEVERVVEVEVEKIVEIQVEKEKIMVATPTAIGVASAPESIEPERPPSPDRPRDTAFEDYARQPMVDARENAVSTFSLDTDRTSFHLALNWTRSGYRVDPDSVRAEEWVNAFDYGYAAPAAFDRFAITSDLLAHPLDDGMYMARVAFKAPEVVADAPLNVTLVLDASGSMADGNRVAIAREAASAIRESLDRNDRISVVHFTTDVIDDFTVESAAPDDRAVADSIGSLYPHDSTNVQAGLDLGVWLADRMRRARPDALNYIILMSDGVANVDATDPFAILESASPPGGANPLRLITVGVGIENYNDTLLEQLAQHGNGWYRYLFDTEQARWTFRRENWLTLASPVADQTRAQVVWNTDAVRSWRIVGYENRVTSAESFTQDRREFAEMYSGAATTVFYELELHDGFGQMDSLGQVELRWVEPDTGRAWSQGSEVVAGGRVAHTDDDPLLGFGAVVALAADRYSALGGPGGPRSSHVRDLRTLRERTEDLGGELGHLAAYRDFAYVLDALLADLPAVAPDDSGYSQ